MAAFYKYYISEQIIAIFVDFGQIYDNITKQKFPKGKFANCFYSNLIFDKKLAYTCYSTFRTQVNITMELFCENSWRLKAFNYFRKKALSQMFD